MKAGLIGLTSVGKRTLFQLLTGSAEAAAGGRPGPRIGIANVPDARVEALARMYQPKKKTPATVEYVLVPGVAKGEGAALVDLPALRGVDTLVHVVRAFESDAAPHPDGSVDPLRDAKMLELELILADLGAVERRLEKLEANIKKANRPEDVAERALFLKLKQALEAEQPLRELTLSDEESRRMRNYSLLSEKPLLLVVNLGEGDVRDLPGTLTRLKLAPLGARPNVALCPVSATIEAEIAQLAPEDARAFMDDLGLQQPGLDRVIQSSYALLGLISFLTAGPDEVRAWPIPDGSTAVDAADAIHTDLARGFIRAEVVPYEDLIALGSTAEARRHGKLRSEGRSYLVRDGDVIEILFSR